jgi:hypothetical protein
VRTPEVQEIYNDLSNCVEAIGRRLNSPKNDPDDLKVLAEALDLTARAVASLSRIMALSV